MALSFPAPNAIQEDIAEIRKLRFYFDKIIAMLPEIEKQLSPNAGIFKQPDFVSGTFKIQLGSVCTCSVFIPCSSSNHCL